jgi:acetyl esterase/lipase
VSFDDGNVISASCRETLGCRAVLDLRWSSVLRRFAERGVGTAVNGRLYAGELDSTDPLVSPLYADLTGLAPIVMFSGTHDIHNPEARDFAARARDAGIPLDYHEEPGGQHVYPLLPTAEGASARALITALIDTTSDQRR